MKNMRFKDMFFGVRGKGWENNFAKARIFQTKFHFDQMKRS